MAARRPLPKVALHRAAIKPRLRQRRHAAAIAAFALPLKLNILVALAAAVAAGLLMEAVDRRRRQPELLLVPADSVMPPEEREHVEAGDLVPLREERHP